MMYGYNLVFSSVHGNALGVILEWRSAAELSMEERRETWWLSLRPLVHEVEDDLEIARADFEKVKQDLAEFLDSAGCGNRFGLKKDLKRGK